MRTDSPFYSHCFDVLHESPLFAGLCEETLQEMLLSFHRETWKKNAPAMSNSQTLEYFYLIIVGRLKISRINPETGRELTIFLLGPGDVFDVICLLDHREHEVIATALDGLEVLCAPLLEAREWISKHPEFNRTLLPYLGKQIRELEELASDLSLHDTATRLAKLIMRHVDHENHQHDLKLINDLTNEELASMIGSVRVVVNRHLIKLKKEGVLETSRKHMHVKNFNSL
jgi:CRP-like cAMP-binding protein